MSMPPSGRGPLERWATFAVRRRRVVLGATLLVSVVAVIAFVDLRSQLDNDLIADPHTESYRGQQLLSEEFGVGVPNVLLLVTATEGTIDDPEVAAAGNALVARLSSEADVSDVVSYWTSGGPAELRSLDGRRGMVVAHLAGTEDELHHRALGLRDDYRGEAGPISVQVGGQAVAMRELGDRSLEDFEAAERLILPLILIALLIVFRSVPAALVSLAVAVVAVLGSALVLRGVVEVTPLSVFALTIVGTLALGLGVDYSLFLVSRYREERTAGWPTEAAVVRAVQTAGRTILFGSAAVMISILAMAFLPLKSMRSMAYGCAATAAMAGVAALVVLPALLAALGPNIDRWALPGRRSRPETEGRWYRLTRWVTGHRRVVAGLGILALLVMSAPALRLNPGFIDERDFPPSVETRAIGDLVRDEFDTRGATPLSVVLTGAGVVGDAAVLDGVAARIAGMPNVTKVIGATGYRDGDQLIPLPEQLASTFMTEDSTYLNVYADVESLSFESDALIAGLRAMPTGADEVLVTGQGAFHRDIVDRIVASTPLIFGAIAIATVLALALQFGSVLIPLKALVLNLLSLTSLLGAAVWIFQDGRLSGVLDYTPTGAIYVTIPVLIFCIGFGLSMDYELFLMSRIKEEHDRSGDDREAIALGVQRSGGIISAAAVLLATVFITTGIASSSASARLFGFGLGFLILLDAFIIRCTVAPALMSLAGRANWWAPAPLRRIHERYAVSEHVELR